MDRQTFEYPQGLSSRYPPLSCLKVKKEEGIWLCQGPEGKVIVKASRQEQAASLLENEARMLKRVEETADPLSGRFPRLVEQGCLGNESFLVRTYLPGMTLSDYVDTVQESEGLPREEALQILLGLLEVLSFLHRQDPPLIHRDVKPQNIIIHRADGNLTVSLIDLEIARSYQDQAPEEEKIQDTQAMGTILFAPPEQFGYQQTDARSDLYAAGVVLRYLLTLEYSPRADGRIDEDIRKVIEKATQFDPSHRYQKDSQMIQAVEELLRAGEKEEKRRPKKRRFFMASLVLVLILALVLVLFGSGERRKRLSGTETGNELQGVIQEKIPEVPQEEIPEASQESPSYTFEEPLIEEAVRWKLGKPEGDITLSDLGKITSLHIFGEQFFSDEADFYFLGNTFFPTNPSLRGREEWQRSGGIRSLKDLEAMENLSELSLYRQEITDLSSLAGKKLTSLGIGYNPLSDLSSLSGNEALRYLNISCLPLSGLECLSGLPGLETLVAAGLGKIDLSVLEGNPIRELNLADSWLVDDSQLKLFPELSFLTVTQLYPGFLLDIQKLPIKTLECTHVSGVQLRNLQVLSGLESLTYRVGDADEEPERLEGEPLLFPSMKELIVKGMVLESLECLGELENLKVLGIYDSEVLSYEGLEGLENLSLIYTNPEQAKALRAQYPAATWTLS